MMPSLLNIVGNTPLVEIKHLNPNPNVKLLAKLEYANPGGSVKDRPALFMIEAGEKSGELTPKKIVLEATSGNTGIGLAMVCAVKGYRLLLCMSEAVSVERQKILKARGAEIMLTPGHLGTDGAIEEVYRLAREHPDKYFLTDQFNNPANWRAHYHGTANEIREQTRGKITSVVATMGTSGTLMGISRRLKEVQPSVRIIGVEPYLGHKIQGLKNMKESYCPELYERNRLDRKVNIYDENAFEMTRQLALKEGLFVGMSSGAAMAAALEEVKPLTEGVVVVIFPDGGERYLSTSLFDAPEQTTLALLNSLGRKRTSFKPRIPGKVGVYTCGPTADHRMRIGECRRMVFADMLVRYLGFCGLDTTHVINITDMDDRTIDGAEKTGETLDVFTRRYIDQFHEDLETLGVRPADHFPKTSEYTPDMLKIVRRLLRKGTAYEKLKSVYFSLHRAESYGELSGIDIGKIRLGHTVDLDAYEKDNPGDFTLLKRSRLSELKRGIFIKSPWGNVRPSWHLQCAAMSMKTLGENFDIHTGGRGHAFPHHENAIAISKALTGKPLARYWLHCDPVLINGKETALSGDHITLTDLLDQGKQKPGWHHRTIRYFLLTTHYRKTVVLSRKKLFDADQALKRIDRFVNALASVTGGDAYPEIEQLVYDLNNGFTNAMDEDLNISKAMAVIFKMIRKVNILLRDQRMNPDDADKLRNALIRVNDVLNILEKTPADMSPKIKALQEKREAARMSGDFEKSDALRNRIRELGVDVRDQRNR